MRYSLLGTMLACTLEISVHGCASAMNEDEMPLAMAIVAAMACARLVTLESMSSSPAI